MDEIVTNLNIKILAAQKHESLSYAFMSAETDEIRMVFTYSVLEEFRLIPTSKCEKKDSAESTKLRNQGNRIFVGNPNNASEYVKAWELYCKGVAFASNNTEELALAFANRSAILVHFQKYSEAVKDIDRALDLNYPDHLKAKLLLRKTECLASLGSSKTTSAYEETLEWLDKMSLDNSSRMKFKEKFKEKLKDVSKISNVKVNGNSEPVVPVIKPQDEILCATNGLAVRYDDKFGRHVVTTRKVQPGEILAVEKPYSLILATENMYTHCAHCLRIAWASIPCEHCVFVVYCSENCRDVAWKKYHDIECPVTGLLLNLDMNKLGLFSMRIAILALREFSSLEKLRAELIEIDSCEDPRTKGFSQDGKLYSNKYRSIYSLVTNTEKRSLPDIFGRAMNAAFIVYFIATHTSFFEQTFDKNDLTSMILNEDVMFVGGLILRHQQIIPSNMHTFGEERSLDSADRGSAALPFYSLINHSCDPNVSRNSLAEHVVLYALYPMEKGTQLFDNYGNHYAIMPKAERQRKLMRQFYFKCECTPCQKNWPMYLELPSFHTLIKSRGDRIKVEKSLQKFNEYVDLATEGKVSDKPYLISDLTRMIEVLLKYVTLPCVEVNNVVETLKRVFALHGNRFEIPDLKRV
ncbi:SET and MYND domain-containing protein 4-like [Belonocnema kinseyi]|uniref:SET and MYND domain-containing protein 4-like n=1 Tax=Belonocnema kinseyi TaxID=2817044 RepID=UPI00143D3DE6|nr:SET and MYND domain-containing protein 4-like [Belonocnema kinseyi]